MRILKLVLLAIALLLSPLVVQAQDAMETFEKAANRSNRIDTLRDIARKWPLPVYEPWNPATAQLQIRQLRAAKKKYERRFPETTKELQEIVDATTPFLRYLYLYDLYYSPTGAVVAPGGVTSLEIDSYCLDAGAPSPPAKEPLKLVRSGNLFPVQILPIYRSLMRHNARQDSNAIQGLLWTLRNIDDGKARLNQIRRSDALLLERIHPGALETMRKTYQLDGILPKLGGKPIRNIGDLIGGVVQQELSSRAGHRVDWTPGDSVETMLARMAGMQAEGRSDPANAYSELAPGVIARAINIQGHSRFGVDFVNTSDRPFVFDISEYIAQPSRRAQRLAFGRLHNVLSPTPGDEAGRQQAKAALLELENGRFADGVESRCRQSLNSPSGDDILTVYSAIPILSELLSAWTLITGKNPFSGEKASWVDRGFAAFDLLTIAAGPAKALARGSKLVVVMKKASNGMRAKPGFNELLGAFANGKFRNVASACRPIENMIPDPEPPTNPTPLMRDMDRAVEDRQAWQCPSGRNARSGKHPVFSSNANGTEAANGIARDFHESYCKQLDGK